MKLKETQETSEKRELCSIKRKCLRKFSRSPSNKISSNILFDRQNEVRHLTLWRSSSDAHKIHVSVSGTAIFSSLLSHGPSYLCSWTTQRVLQFLELQSTRIRTSPLGHSSNRSMAQKITECMERRRKMTSGLGMVVKGVTSTVFVNRNPNVKNSSIRSSASVRIYHTKVRHLISLTTSVKISR